MKDRILKIIQQNGLTTAKFADEIGVQASGISHILSGRNNPSYDFIVKILTKYPKINPEWLILGHGAMFKSLRQATIFDSLPEGNSASTKNSIQSLHSDLASDKLPAEKSSSSKNVRSFVDINSENAIERIVIFYKNKTFKEYLPDEK